jgi:hypothetical protein
MIHATKNFRKAPARGILKEIASEEGTTIQAVWNAINVHRNVRIIEIFSRKLKVRKDAYKKALKGYNEIINNN